MKSSPHEDSGQLFRSALACSPIAVFAIDTEHRVVCWNTALEKLTGVTASEVLGTKRHWRAFYSEERPLLADLVLKGIPREVENRYRDKELTAGTINSAYEVTDFFPQLGESGLWLRFAADEIKDSGGRVIGAVETIVEITERKLLEKRIEDLNVLKQRLLGMQSLEEKLKLITDTIVSAFNADFARIWMTMPADLCSRGCRHATVTEGPHVCRNRMHCLHLVASSGRYTHTDGGHRRVPLGCYKIGRVASDEEPSFITNDVLNDPRVHDHDWARSLGLVAFAGHRLLSPASTPIGVLALFSKHAIQDEDAHLLEDLANTASQVIVTGQAQEERDRLANVVRHSSELVNLSNLDGTMIFLNEAGSAMLGIEADQAACHTIMDVIPEHLRELARSEVLEALRAGRTWEGDLQYFNLKTGGLTDVHAHCFSIRDPNTGLPLYFANVSQDITARKKAQEDRDRLFNASLDMFCVAGHDGYLKQINPAWERTLGWTESRLLSRPWIDFVHPEDRQATLAAGVQLAEGSPVKGFVNRYRCRDGSFRWLSWDSSTLPKEGLILSVVRDVTDVRRMEEHLRHSEKMEAIGQLAGGVAHDFNNQLTGILGFAELLSNRLEDETLRRQAELILISAKRSAELTRQLLAFARKGKYQSAPVDMHRVVAEVASLLQHTLDRRVIVKQTLQANPPTVLGDPTQLQNALLNLALNARDAMPDGGELMFATSVVTLSEEYCRANSLDFAPGQCLQLSIADTGVGMSEEVRKHLFEPFFTTKGPGRGTGMGLAAVYGIVKSHKGGIHVYSEPGRGTTVRIYLPLLTAKEETTGTVAHTMPDRGNARILIVDDEEVVLRLATDVLGTLGYTVRTCANGAEAVALYEKEWRAIDLVVLDMVMPVLGGRETYLAMKKINPSVRAILASGYSLNGLAQSILDEGVLDFVQKPFLSHELASKVAAALKAGDKSVSHSAST